MIGRDVDIPIPKFQSFSAFILPQSKHVLEFSALLVVQFEIAAFWQAHQLRPSLDSPCCKPQSCLLFFSFKAVKSFWLVLLNHSDSNHQWSLTVRTCLWLCSEACADSKWHYCFFVLICDKPNWLVHWKKREVFLFTFSLTHSPTAPGKHVWTTSFELYAPESKASCLVLCF